MSIGLHVKRALMDQQVREAEHRRRSQAAIRGHRQQRMNIDFEKWLALQRNRVQRQLRRRPTARSQDLAETAATPRAECIVLKPV